MPVNFIAELANFENISYPATAEFTLDGEVLKIDYDKFLVELATNKVMKIDNSFKLRDQNISVNGNNNRTGGRDNVHNG